MNRWNTRWCLKLSCSEFCDEIWNGKASWIQGYARCPCPLLSIHENTSDHNYHRLPKIRSHFLDTILRQKWGGGVCSDIQFVYTPPSIPTREINNHDDYRGFLEERQLNWTCTIRSTWVHIMPGAIEATFIVSAVTGNEPGKFAFPVREWHKTWLQSMTELNQMLTKSMPRRRSIRGIYTRENTLCKNLGVKEGEGVCSKGVYFRELVVYMIIRLSSTCL